MTLRGQLRATALAIRMARSNFWKGNAEAVYKDS